MRANPPEPASFVTFTEEILNGKIHFLCSDGRRKLWSFKPQRRKPCLSFHGKPNHLLQVKSGHVSSLSSATSITFDNSLAGLLCFTYLLEEGYGELLLTFSSFGCYIVLFLFPCRFDLPFHSTKLSESIVDDCYHRLIRAFPSLR